MKVLCFIGGYGLAYDERQRKEALELKSLGYDVEIIISEPSNEEKRGKTSYDIDYQSIRLFSRKYLPRKKFVVIKAIEMHLRMFIIFLNKKWDVLWIHDHDMAPLLFYGWLIRFFFRKKIIVWDQHELASQKLFKNPFYHLLLQIPDVIIHANNERAEALRNCVPQKISNKFFVIENFPESNISKVTTNQLNPDFEKWLNGSSYILFQGIAVHHRKIIESVEAVYSFENLKLLVLGPCSEEIKIELEKKWPNYQERIFITGWINPEDFNIYMDHALASLIFYENLDLNHWLCAPNRFYIALLGAIPIICGPNPTMANIISKYDCGVVCMANGTDIQEINTAISKVIVNHHFYRTNCLEIRDNFTWESQRNVFEKILKNK